MLVGGLGEEYRPRKYLLRLHVYNFEACEVSVSSQTLMQGARPASRARAALRRATRPQQYTGRVTHHLAVRTITISRTCAPSTGAMRHLHRLTSSRLALAVHAHVHAPVRVMTAKRAGRRARVQQAAGPTCQAWKLDSWAHLALLATAPS